MIGDEIRPAKWYEMLLFGLFWGGFAATMMLGILRHSLGIQILSDSLLTGLARISMAGLITYFAIVILLSAYRKELW